MEYWQISVLIIVGIFAGWLNVMAGGGSLLTVPAMLFMDISAPIANGTNRIAILAQNITAFIAFYRKGYSDIKLSLSLSFFATLGAIAGARIGVQLEGVWFNRILVIVLLLVLFFMLTDNQKSRKSPLISQKQKPKNQVLGHFLMIFAGFWGGLIQIGVGFVFMPILYRVMGFDLIHVNMYKITIILFYTLVALFIFASQLELMWWVGLGLAIGNSIGGWLGAHSTIHKGEQWIKTVLYVSIIGMIVKLIFF